MSKRVIVAINRLNPSAMQSLQRLQQSGMDIHVIVLRDIRVAPQDRTHSEAGDLAIEEIETDFFDAARLQADLESFRDTLAGVVSRGESSIQYLAKLSDICRQWGVALPTSESLEIAVDKQRMRQRFSEYAPEITPAFMKVVDTSDATMQAINTSIGYPLIIKPANLASSLLIQKCHTPEQATRAIAEALAVVKKLYDEGGRYEEPTIIVEQLLEGDLYSVDVYAADDGELFYCPPVGYVTGQSIGVDDFFLYRRSAPTQLDAADWDACKIAVASGIHAIGLRATTAHVELCHTQDGWKIIEIGPRVGRYRIEMYREVFGIEHSDNDVKVRLGMKPSIPTEPVAYCAVYSVYPHQEGLLEQLTHYDELHSLQSLVKERRFAHDGSEVHFAKHGGHALAEVILAHKDKKQFDQDCAWFEAHVHAKVGAL